MCNKTYASNGINKNIKAKTSQIKTNKYNYNKRKSEKYFILGNFYITTGLLNFNNNNWEYIFIEKSDLKLGIYWGIANLGLGLRINDSLLIRIIGLNILECIPIFYVWFQFHKKDWNKAEVKSKKSYESDEGNPDLTKIHTANREKKAINYIRLMPIFSLFNFMSIEIRIAEYWCFNINFTQSILILLKIF